MTIADVNIDVHKRPWVPGQMVHVQRQSCSMCGTRMGGIAIDLDYVEKGEEVLKYMVEVLRNYKCRSLCENCITQVVLNQLDGSVIGELK